MVWIVILPLLSFKVVLSLTKLLPVLALDHIAPVLVLDHTLLLLHNPLLLDTVLPADMTCAMNDNRSIKDWPKNH